MFAKLSQLKLANALLDKDKEALGYSKQLIKNFNTTGKYHKQEEMAENIDMTEGSTPNSFFEKLVAELPLRDLCLDKCLLGHKVFEGLMKGMILP